MSNPGWDRILTASKDNNASEIRRLVLGEGVSPSHANGVGQSAIHVAALWGNIDAVETLISLGAKLNLQNTITGGTPLHCLATSTKKPLIHRMECARILMKAGADPTIPDSYGSMPVNYVEDVDVPEPELLDAFPHFRNKTLSMVLDEGVPKLKIFDFIQDGNVDDVHKTLEETKDVDLKIAKDSGGNGLVGFTMQQILKHFEESESKKNAPLPNLIEILNLLLCVGELDPNVPDKNGEVPIYTICYTMNSLYSLDEATSTMQYLEQAAMTLLQNKATLAPKVIQLIHDASRRGNVEMIRFMVEKLKVDPNTKGRQGFTALHFAARSGRLETLEYLIGCGAEVKGEDDRGKTAMDYAVANNREEIIKVLKSHFE